jgi:intracellular septation protein A
MKILFDFLPILLFFVAFKYAEGHKEWAAAFATSHFGGIVAGGVVGPGEAPVLLATVVVIIATLARTGVAGMQVAVVLYLDVAWRQGLAQQRLDAGRNRCAWGIH